MRVVGRVAPDAASAWEEGADLAPGFARVVWAYLAGLFAAGDLGELRTAALDVLSVIPGSPVLFNEVDFCRGAVSTISDPPAATAPPMTAAYARLRHEHPVISRYEGGEAAGPLAISDVTDERSFTSTALYAEVFTQLGMCDQLLIPVPARHARAMVSLCVGRLEWGFSEEEHAAAGLIQQVLEVIYGSMWDRRFEQTAIGVTGGLLERSGMQVCVVDKFGEIHGLNGNVGDLGPSIEEAVSTLTRLAQITPAQEPASGPRPVVAELRVTTSSGEPVTVQLLASTDGEVWPITIRHTSSSSRIAAFVARGLTQRQAEVMALLLAGRTTAAAALELGISPRTAEKHITLACQALGTHSRTDALIALASGDDVAAA